MFVLTEPVNFKARNRVFVAVYTETTYTATSSTGGLTKKVLLVLFKFCVNFPFSNPYPFKLIDVK